MSNVYRSGASLRRIFLAYYLDVRGRELSNDLSLLFRDSKRANGGVTNEGVGCPMCSLSANLQHINTARQWEKSSLSAN